MAIHIHIHRSTKDASVTYHNETIRESIARDVLKKAREVGDSNVAAMANRCIAAWRLGKKADENDWKTVKFFYEEAR